MISLNKVREKSPSFNKEFELNIKGVMLLVWEYSMHDQLEVATKRRHDWIILSWIGDRQTECVGVLSNQIQ
ncbi:hypothetical protein V2J09_013330 [Rumex salicifolius]